MLTVLDVDFYAVSSPSQKTHNITMNQPLICHKQISFAGLLVISIKIAKQLKGLVSTHPSGWGCLYLVASPS